MNRLESGKRVKRINNEEVRLKKEIWRRIQKTICPYFYTCAQFPDEPIVVCTKRKDNELGHTWDNAVEYKIPHSDEEDDVYIAITKSGFFNYIYFAAAYSYYTRYTTKQLYGILKQVENRKFNNVVKS